MRVRLRRASVPILIGTLLCLVAGCGGNGAPQLPPGIQVEGQIALYGTKVLEATDQALTAVDTLAEAKVINSADTVAIVTRLKQVGTEGKRLAEALKVVDEARADSPERRTALSTARQIIETIQKLVDQAISLESIQAETGAPPRGALLLPIARRVITPNHPRVRLAVLLVRGSPQDIALLVTLRPELVIYVNVPITSTAAFASGCP